MAAEAVSNAIDFVGSVIVHDQMDVGFGRNHGVDLGEELQSVCRFETAARRLFSVWSAALIASVSITGCGVGVVDITHRD